MGKENASEQIARLAEAQTLQRGRRLDFSTRLWTGTGESRVLALHRVSRTGIERHVKVRGEANLFDPRYTEYFERRRCFAWRTYSYGNAGNQTPAGVEETSRC